MENRETNFPAVTWKIKKGNKENKKRNFFYRYIFFI